MKLPASEDTLDKEQIYDDAAVMQQRPVSGMLWPGNMKNWLYSRKLRPTVITGALVDSQTFEENWISGFVDFMEALSGYTWSTFWAALHGQLVNWLNANNTSDASLIVTDTEVNVASQAALTLTCAAGHSYRVKHAGLSNANRAPQIQLTYTPSGGTATVHLFPAGVQTVENIAIGQAGVAAGVTGTNVMNEFWMQAGDTLEISDGNFVAADVMRHQFIYEDWDIV